MGCHCETCRRWSGHYWSATACKLSDIQITGIENLTWFQSSETAKRGFCKYCGSSLFWQVTDRETISIGAGTIDLPSNIKQTSHIHTKEKSDYYGINKLDE